MDRVANSWSKPGGMAKLIARKQVDKSMFVSGSHIPQAFYADFAAANGGDLPALGEDRNITLIYNNTEYQARLSHQPRRDSGGARLLLVYTRSSPFAALLREQLSYSYRLLDVDNPASPMNRSPDAIPEGEREYVEFYQTDQPYRYTVRLISRNSAGVTEPSAGGAPVPFAHVWSDLGRILRAGTIVPPLDQGPPNTVSCVDDKGISLKTAKGTDLLPKAWFESTWQLLGQMGILAAENVPGEARHRPADMAAILVHLPCVEYTTYPRLTLFLKSHRFTNAQIAETFKVGTQRGIRVAGRAPDTRLVVFITGEAGDPNRDHPYRDRWEGDTFYYTGEGLTGAQEMTHGNRALKNNITQDFPIYGFQKLASGHYAYIGRFKVTAVHEEQQPDAGGNLRRVFVFAMQRRKPELLERTAPDDAGSSGHDQCPAGRPEVEYLRVAAPPKPELWTACQASGVIRLAGWDALGDLGAYPNPDALEQAVERQLAAVNQAVPSLVRRRARELWTFRKVAPGTRVLVSQGASTVLAVAEVAGSGYTWLPEQPEARHALQVNWLSLGARRIPRQPEWTQELVSTVTPKIYESVLAQPVRPAPPRLDLAAVVHSFSAALRVSGVVFGDRHDEIVRSFVASLATKRFVILTGMSGSGKTQIALRFGDWLGRGRRMVVPVRPDWTGPDALFGYEDALQPPLAGRRAWHVPEVLAFMLQAARDPEYPYLLVLDEMNLAHVERYFADFLSGMESGEPCLPHLAKDDQGTWRVPPDGPAVIPVPENLFVVGTVNVDETTYMFSPKVLDRANTFEFRVHSDDLSVSLKRPLPVDPGEDELVRGFLAIATDDAWQEIHPAPERDRFAEHFRTVHQLLADGDFAFGHRVFYEALRYASMLAAAGNAGVEAALDQQVYQKVLPRLHGARRRLEPILRALGRFCWDLAYAPAAPAANPFDPEAPGDGQPRLPLSFHKVRRMFRSLRANQFTSFTE